MKGVMLFPAFHVLREKAWVSSPTTAGELLHLFLSLLCSSQLKGQGQQASGRAEIKSVFSEACATDVCLELAVCSTLATPAEKEATVFN